MIEFICKYCGKTYIGKAYNSHFQVCKPYKDAKKNWNKFCECGCGGLTNFNRKYLEGHNFRIKDKTRYEKISKSLKNGYFIGRIKSRKGIPTRIKTSGFLGHKHSNESKNKILNSLMKTLSQENYIHPNKGKIRNKESNLKCAETLKRKRELGISIGRPKGIPQIITKERNNKISNSIISNPKERQRRSEQMKNYNLNKKDYSKVWNKGMSPWKWMKISENDFYEMLSKSQNKRPNNFEQKFIGIIRKNKLPFNYVGNGEIWINGKNPDFIHNDKKILIELLGNFWHNEKEVKERIKHFKKYGYKTITIWENEIKKLNDNKILEILINKMGYI